MGPLPLSDGTSILYRSDRGADENWSIFRIGIAGGDPIDLTPGQRLQRDRPIVPQNMPDTMFYSARKLTELASALYSQKIAPDSKPQRLYGESSPGGLLDVSADGRQALWLRGLALSEGHVMLIDLQTGVARELYPGAGRKARVSDAAFASDAKKVFIASDEGGEEAVLLALDVAGKELARYVEEHPANALLRKVCPSPKGDRLAVTVVAGDHDELRLLETTNMRAVDSPKLPVGSGDIAACPHIFSPDGKRLLAGWSTPQSPSNIFSIDIRSGEAARLRDQKRSGLTGLPAIETHVVETRAFDGGRIPMLVYRPSNVRGKLPVIVSYHGGPVGVSKARWSPQIRFFTSLGYAYVEPNVRGSIGFGRAFEEGDNGHKRLAAFKDIETSARWIAGQPWADKERLVVFGGSYGGYTTLIGLTRQPDIWRAGVDQYGIADLRTLFKTTTGVLREFFKQEFGEPGKDDEFLGSISPIRDVQRIVDPLFVYAGANDPRVPRSESDMIVAAVRKKGVPIEYMVKDNEGHSLARKENQVEFYARVARFLEKHIDLPADSHAK
jgi:dipeptidyl aminopeptidase/acylaminoacyl peptidase